MVSPGKQAAVGEDLAQVLAVVLHDLAWLLPRTVRAEVDDDLGPSPLPASELEIMRLLVRRPGLTVGEVARELGMQQTNVSTAVRALAARGLLDRAREPADRRIVRLEPTALASAQHDALESAWGRVLAGRLEQLPAAQRARVLRCAAPLQVLAERLSP